MDQCRLRSDLQTVLEQFSNLKVNYCNLKIQLRAKEEIIELQNSTMEAANRRVDMMAKALENYQRCYQNNLHKLQGENYQLSKTIEELEERCQTLQDANRELIMEANRNNNTQAERLEDEIQLLRAQIVSEEQRHKREVRQLREEHEKQMCDKELMIEELNQKITKLVEQTIPHRPFVHPALYDEVKKLKYHPPVKRKSPNSAFNWPDLNVEKITKKPDPDLQPKKKKKLYREDQDEPVDLL